MKCFKDFLEEAIEFRKDEYHSGHMSTVLEHEKYIGPHILNMNFTHDHETDEHHINFEVNGTHETHEANVDPEHGQKIMQHVATVVHAYKQAHQPRDVVMSGNNAVKDKLYGKFAKSMAKHYGGEYYTEKDHNPFTNEMQNFHHVRFK